MSTGRVVMSQLNSNADYYWFLILRPPVQVQKRHKLSGVTITTKAGFRRHATPNINITRPRASCGQIYRTEVSPMVSHV
jgi:hypothetical protein